MNGARTRAAPIRLRDGSTVEVRALMPDDRPLVAAAFERMSEQSRYRRFFLRLGELPPPLLDSLVAVDHRDREALVALDPRTRQLLGVARYARSPADRATAEIAVTVVDDWQGLGLGAALLERLIVRAREEGITRISAEVLGENPAALALISGIGTAVQHLDHGVLELVVDLPTGRGAGDRLRDALRGAASGALVPARTLADRLLP